VEDTQPTEKDAAHVLAPFYTAELNHRQRIQAIVGNLSNEDLNKVLDLFARDNAQNVPWEFWMLASRVRAHIKVELKKRAKENT
jgi:hypothetical protein